ncbi:collagen-like protein [Streptomyces sp. NPDC058202]|uniref:collagen-like protein n=1 Tax=Streptomyces sp. NPDC058202 TaxID=3346380 RepID=UPI0036EE8F2A
MRRHATTDDQARRERRRGDLRWAAVLLALGALLTAVVVGGAWIAGELRTANQARDALAAQVQRLGASPIGGPPGSRGDPAPRVTGPSGLPGHAGESGAPGRDGRDGKNGRDTTGSPGQPGKDGSKGDPGASATGAPGAPGGVGPSGPAGATGAQGPAGKDGKDGRDGTDGRDGQDGQTCPAGYSLQQSQDDPDALVCRRDDAPTQQPDSPSPSSPISLGMPGLDPSRRTWI